MLIICPGLGITRVRFNGYNLSPRNGEHPLGISGAKIAQGGQTGKLFHPFLFRRAAGRSQGGKESVFDTEPDFFR